MGKKLRAWIRINRGKKKRIQGLAVPDRNDEYFLYQTLIGAWPFSDADYPDFVQRIKAYIVKAVREAKVHTAWLKPDTEYENAYVSFVEKILARSEANEFLKELIPFCRRVSRYGMLNSLSQTLIKITSPGVPDFYQGAELWDLNLVDPDNRRPVDFEKGAPCWPASVNWMMPILADWSGTFFQRERMERLNSFSFIGR